MDWFPIVFDTQLVLLVIVLVIWARKPARRRRRRNTAGVRCTDGKVVGGITPSMSAEEVIAVCNSLTP